MKNLQILTIFSVIIVSLISCRKVIEIDLKGSDSQIVIEGNITNEAGPYKVKITKTVNLNASNSFPAITNAKVIIRDNTGIIDTLSQPIPGEYQTSKTIGKPGNTYNLTVLIDGKSYNSMAKMPSFIPIDSMYLADNPFDVGSKLKTVPVTILTDKAGESNYFRIVEYWNNKKSIIINVLDDKFLADGQKVEIPNYGNTDERFVNDSVKVEIQCLDKAMYEYYLSIPISGGPVPANPNSNISGGCFGYFSVHAFSRKTLKVK